MSSLSSDAPGAFWHEIAQRDAAHFSEAFTPDVTFETTTCNIQIRGAKDMRSLLLAMSSLYETLAFKTDATVGLKTFLEWEGRALGQPIGGVTVIRRNEAGLIASVHLHQRPLGVVVAFARALSEKLGESRAQHGFSI